MALEVERLQIATRTRQLVHGISLDVLPGERVALLGESGSGKSLTASAVLGSLSQTLTVGGQLIIDGKPIAWSARPSARPGLAAVFQDSCSALNPLTSVGSQIGDAVRRAGRTKPEAREHTLELLHALGFEQPNRVARSAPGLLSGGQRQRACLALALATRASLVVADEPTTALDTISQAEVIHALWRHTGGPGRPALLFITHDIAVASQLCGRGIVMHDGRLVEQAPMSQLIREPQHPWTRALVDAARQPAVALPGDGRAAA